MIGKKFHESVQKRKKEFGIEYPEETQYFNQWWQGVFDKRNKVYLENCVKRYGSELVEKTLRWVNEELSPHQVSKLASIDDAIERFAGVHPERVGHEGIKKLFDKEGRRVRVKNPLDEEIGMPFQDPETSEVGEALPEPKQKPALPNLKALRKMPLEDLRRLIEAQKGEGE